MSTRKRKVKARLVSSLEAAAELGVTRCRVKQLLKANRIKGAKKVGGRVVGTRKINGAWVIPSPVVILPPQ